MAGPESERSLSSEARQGRPEEQEERLVWSGGRPTGALREPARTRFCKTDELRMIFTFLNGWKKDQKKTIL